MKKTILVCGFILAAGAVFGRGTPVKTPVLPGDAVRLQDLNFDAAQILAVSLKEARPSGQTVSITDANGNTEWFSDIIASRNDLDSNETLLVWESQTVTGRLVFPTTVTGATIAGVDKRIDINMYWDTDPTPNSNIGVFYFKGTGLKISRINLINYCDNTAAVSYGYTAYLYNDTYAEDCGFYFVGNYKHATENHGYKVLVVVAPSSGGGAATVKNCTVGTFKVNKSASDYTQVGAFHGSITGGSLENVTFISGNEYMFDLGGFGLIDFINCRGNFSHYKVTEMSEQESAEICPDGFRYLLPLDSSFQYFNLLPVAALNSASYYNCSLYSNWNAISWNYRLIASNDRIIYVPPVGCVEVKFSLEFDIADLGPDKGANFLLGWIGRRDDGTEVTRNLYFNTVATSGTHYLTITPPPLMEECAFQQVFIYYSPGVDPITSGAISIIKTVIGKVP